MTVTTNDDIAASLQYTNLMLEHVFGQNQAVLETVGAVPEQAGKR